MPSWRPQPPLLLKDASTPTSAAVSTSSGWPAQAVGSPAGFAPSSPSAPARSCFFVYGFAKSAKANVTAKELEALQAYAALLLGYGAGELKQAVDHGELVELELQADADQDPQA